MKKWNERLVEAMQLRGVSAADLSRMTNKTPPAIKKWLDGKTSTLSYEDVRRISQSLEIPVDWLMEGEGSLADIAKVGSSDLIEIENVRIKGSCGFGTINFEDVPEINKLLVTEGWFHKNFRFYSPDKIKIITAEGDSMSPEIEDGDALFIDISDNQYVRDGIYAILVDEELFIKRVQKLLGKRFALISTNKQYKDLEISADSDIDVKVIGRVLKVMSLNDL